GGEDVGRFGREGDAPALAQHGDGPGEDGTRVRTVLPGKDFSHEEGELRSSLAALRETASGEGAGYFSCSFSRVCWAKTRTRGSGSLFCTFSSALSTSIVPASLPPISPSTCITLTRAAARAKNALSCVLPAKNSPLSDAASGSTAGLPI